MKTKIHLICFFTIIVSGVIFTGCTPTVNLSPMQKRQLTTKMYDCSYETAYRASLTVFQDQSYVIKNTDMDSGLIVANVDRATSGGSQVLQAVLFGYVPDKGTEVEVSCIVNRLNDISTEIRINIQEVKYGQSSFLSGTSKQNSKQIYEPELYYHLFNEIQIEIKRREAYEGLNTAVEPENIKRTNPENIKETSSVIPKEKVIAIVDIANIHLYTDIQSPVIKAIEQGTILEVHQTHSDWYEVIFLSDDGQFSQIGFIRKGEVQTIEENAIQGEKIEQKNVIISLIDGSVIQATILSHSEQEIVVKTSLGILTIKRENIEKIEPDKN